LPNFGTGNLEMDSRIGFDLYISQFVLDEAAAGGAETARERLAALQGLPILHLSEDVVDLAEALKISLALPEKAVADAAHISLKMVPSAHREQFDPRPLLSFAHFSLTNLTTSSPSNILGKRISSAMCVRRRSNCYGSQSRAPAVCGSIEIRAVGYLLRPRELASNCLSICLE